MLWAAPVQAAGSCWSSQKLLQVQATLLLLKLARRTGHGMLQQQLAVQLQVRPRRPRKLQVLAGAALGRPVEDAE